MGRQPQEFDNMTPDFISRLIGMVFFALIGARFGADAAPGLGLPDTPTSIIFSMIGVLFGLLVGPWIIVMPLRALRRSITETPVDTLLTSLIGLIGGLAIALLLAYPLSQLQPPFGNYAPTVASALFGYAGLVLFRMRSRELLGMLGERSGKRARSLFMGGERLILLDTSVLIDGRIVDIAQTGFLGGALAVPRFVISELHQVADSTDPLRRARGRHGLQNLTKLQQDGMNLFKIIEEDIPDVSAVDDKLVALALKMNSLIITNDNPLNNVAEAQGVMVLNVNLLANAVRSMYLPGESFAIRIIQEGREPDQGVGYLDDGTMVVVEGGRQYMDRTIQVMVTRFINRPTGRMYFAVPDKT
jgi:uncharacterized protein YacL